MPEDRALKGEVGYPLEVRKPKYRQKAAYFSGQTIPDNIGAAALSGESAMEGAPAEERKAILKVIEDETAAYFAKDYDAWAECWAHEPYTRRWMSLARGGIFITEGWEIESRNMRSAMARFPSPLKGDIVIRRENLNIRVGVDMAWVTFDQIARHTGDPFDVAGLQHEMRILEKHDGKWKIVCCSPLQPSFEFVDSPLLRIDEKALVIWMNDAASEQIKSHGGLIVSGGRLRAADRSTDQRLQAAIRWAAHLEDHHVAWRASSSGSALQMSIPPAIVQKSSGVVLDRYGALPVVFSTDDEGRAAICWVIADSGMILVAFTDEHTISRRLAVAAAIYGITPAQLRLAELIVAGRDLVDAARQLRISANTARTHLQRMFDKTGVRSQPALVRVLLSAVSPAAA